MIRFVNFAFPTRKLSSRTAPPPSVKHQLPPPFCLIKLINELAQFLRNVGRPRQPPNPPCGTTRPCRDDGRRFHRCCCCWPFTRALGQGRVCSPPPPASRRPASLPSNSSGDARAFRPPFTADALPLHHGCRRTN